MRLRHELRRPARCRNACILQKQPELLPEEQRDLLLNCCTAFDPNEDATHGKGLVSLEKILNA